MSKLLPLFSLVTLTFTLPAAGQLVWTAEGHRHIVNSVAFSPDGTYLASGSRDSTIFLWEVATGREVRRHTVGRSVHSVVFSPDGTHLAVAAAGGRILLWEVATGKVERRFTASDRRTVRSVAFSPNGMHLMGGVEEGSENNPRVRILLWEVATGKEVHSFRLVDRVAIYQAAAAFSSDGTYLAMGDWTVGLWDMALGLKVRTFKVDNVPVGAVAFSPDGMYLATGLWDRRIFLWDRRTGRLAQTFEQGLTFGHPVYSVAFSPDGTHLASGDRRGRYVRLWDVSTGQVVRSFEGDHSSIRSVAFSPDGTYLASGSGTDDGRYSAVRLWEVAATNTASEISPDPELPTFTHYPNPAESFITVEYALSDVSAVKLFVRDLLGREVVSVLNAIQTGGSHRMQLNTESLPSGVYFLHVVTNGKQMARPLVVY